jgi:hypothetical protein
VAVRLVPPSRLGARLMTSRAHREPRARWTSCARSSPTSRIRHPPGSRRARARGRRDGTATCFAWEVAEAVHIQHLEYYVYYNAEAAGPGGGRPCCARCTAPGAPGVPRLSELPPPRPRRRHPWAARRLLWFASDAYTAASAGVLAVVSGYAAGLDPRPNLRRGLRRQHGHASREGDYDPSR